MERFEPFVSFAVALGAGLLIGLQREQSAAQEGRSEGGYSGGIRTFPIISLAGGLAMMVAEKLSPWIFPVAFAVVMAPVVVAYWFEVKSGGDRGVTSEVAFSVTFLLGGVALSGGLAFPPNHRLLVVGALAVATTGLLSLKQPLHQLASRVSREDLYSTLKFLVLAVIILPLLPNREVGPLKVLNPFTVGLIIVLLAGVGFVAYVAIRLVGPGLGLGLTGLVGGLISSTAVALTVSSRARKSPALAHSGPLAVVLASTVMVVRIAILLAATNPALLGKSAAMLGAMTAAGALGSFVLYLRARRGSTQEVSQGEIPFHNPFELAQAFKFGLLFVMVLLASKAATHYLGGLGAYLAAAVGGLADVDAVTLSISRLEGTEIASQAARWAILIGASSNSVVKAALAVLLGGWSFGRWVLACLFVTMGTGAAVVVLLPS
jgi:uncharacterized membrane protein (DUF4010 family)